MIKDYEVLDDDLDTVLMVHPKVSNWEKQLLVGLWFQHLSVENEFSWGDINIFARYPAYGISNSLTYICRKKPEMVSFIRRLNNKRRYRVTPPGIEHLKKKWVR